jgi:hypothetical protein
VRLARYNPAKEQRTVLGDKIYVEDMNTVGMDFMAANPAARPQRPSPAAGTPRSAPPNSSYWAAQTSVGFQWNDEGQMVVECNLQFKTCSDDSKPWLRVVDGCDPIFSSASWLPPLLVWRRSPLAAQPNPSPDAKTMNFDLWCQNGRLSRRHDATNAPLKMRKHSKLIRRLEHYEVPNRSAQYDQGRVNRDIMNNDPIDNAQKDNLGVQRQYPDISVTDSPPK